MTKSKAAFLFASQTLEKQRLFLWTFTFKDVLTVKETRKRWNHLLREQAAPGLKVTSRAFGIGRKMPIAQKYVD